MLADGNFSPSLEHHGVSQYSGSRKMCGCALSLCFVWKYVSTRTRALACYVQCPSDSRYKANVFHTRSKRVSHVEQLAGRMLLQWCNRCETSEIQAKAYSGQRGTRTCMRSIYTTLVYVCMCVAAVECETCI